MELEHVASRHHIDSTLLRVNPSTMFISNTFERLRVNSATVHGEWSRNMGDRIGPDFPPLEDEE